MGAAEVRDIKHHVSGARYAATSSLASFGGPWGTEPE
jgi:hypothetical protein